MKLKEFSVVILFKGKDPLEGEGRENRGVVWVDQNYRYLTTIRNFAKFRISNRNFCEILKTADL